jgi:cold shock protein
MARGTVKFFNPTKGFGFISPESGGPDVFVHISAVQQAGLPGVDEGDQVEYELEQDRRSGKVSAVDLILTGRSPAPARGPTPARFERAPRRESFGRAPAGSMSGPTSGSGDGVVKWFNPAKGFGFIAPNDGGGDVFVHVSAVERAGLAGLNEGQALAYDLEADRRSGKTSAVNLRPL